jgi:serine/threonine protein kinase
MTENLHISIVKHISAQIVNALCYCKTLNICHRDLKPENIMLDSNFDIKMVS